ncbi:MAG: hypothetical protein ACTS4W_01480 [Candidatus Hodgkinia cicadicola]
MPTSKQFRPNGGTLPPFAHFEMNDALPLSKPADASERIALLSPFGRHLAFAFGWLSGIDVIERMMYVDGTFSVLRSALAKGGIIFADSHPFQHILDLNVFKHKVVCVTRLLILRSKTPCGPFNDVLAKIASVLDPSSCVLALGTWQLPIALALNALRSNAIPVAATVLSPLLPPPPSVWNDWLCTIASSRARPFCAILTPLVGLEVIGVLFDVSHYWKSPLRTPISPSVQQAPKSTKPTLT